jgi:hypothetical protein
MALMGGLGGWSHDGWRPVSEPLGWGGGRDERGVLALCMLMVIPRCSSSSDISERCMVLEFRISQFVCCSSSNLSLFSRARASRAARCAWADILVLEIGRLVVVGCEDVVIWLLCVMYDVQSSVTLAVVLEVEDGRETYGGERWSRRQALKNYYEVLYAVEHVARVASLETCRFHTENTHVCVFDR